MFIFSIFLIADSFSIARESEFMYVHMYVCSAMCVYVCMCI